MRKLFVIICVLNDPQNPNANEVFQIFKQDLIEDFERDFLEELAEQMALKDIDSGLRFHNSKQEDFALPAVSANNS